MKIDSPSSPPQLPPFSLLPFPLLPERRKFVVRVKTAAVGLIRQVERRGKYSRSLHFRELLKLLLDRTTEREGNGIAKCRFRLPANLHRVFCGCICACILHAKLHFIFVFFALARKLKQRAIYRHEYILISKGNYLIFANLVKTFILYYC